MKKNQNVPQIRWFIWTVVFIVVSMVGLSTYVWYVGSKDVSDATTVSMSQRLQDGLGCPNFQKNKALYSVSVFDGPPEQMAELIADSAGYLPNRNVYGTWGLSYIFKAGRYPYLVCKYGNSTHSEKVVIKVSSKVNSCEYLEDSKTKVVTVMCK